MKNISLANKEFKLIIRGSQVKDRVAQVAERINRDYADREILFLAVLNGAFMFTAELVRHIKPLCRLSFVKVASYVGDTTGGVVRELIGLREDLNDRHVVLLEDIVDTGFTLDHVMRQIKTTYKPASIAVATLLFKPQSYRKSLPVEYTGFEIPNDFVVGWGLDYEGYGRNLNDIYVMKS